MKPERVSVLNRFTARHNSLLSLYQNCLLIHEEIFFLKQLQFYLIENIIILSQKLKKFTINKLSFRNLEKMQKNKKKFKKNYRHNVPK